MQCYTFLPSIGLRLVTQHSFCRHQVFAISPNSRYYNTRLASFDLTQPTRLPLQETPPVSTWETRRGTFEVNGLLSFAGRVVLSCEGWYNKNRFHDAWLCQLMTALLGGVGDKLGIQWDRRTQRYHRAKSYQIESDNVRLHAKCPRRHEWRAPHKWISMLLFEPGSHHSQETKRYLSDSHISHSFERYIWPAFSVLTPSITIDRIRNNAYMGISILNIILEWTVLRNKIMSRSFHTWNGVDNEQGPSKRGSLNIGLVLNTCRIEYL